MTYNFYVNFFLIFLFISPSSGNEREDETEMRRFKRATGDPCNTFFTLVPKYFSPVLTTAQWMSLLNTGYGAFMNCSGPELLNSTNVAAAASSLNNTNASNLTSINGTNISISGVNSTALNALISCMEPSLMGWATPQLMTFLPLLTVYTTLNTNLSTTANPNGTANCIGHIIYVMENNLKAFGNQMLNKYETYQADKRSLNATLREACIMGCNFFQIYMIKKIIANVKAYFTPNICSVVYASLNGKILNLDLYNFTASACTGTIDCTSCSSPCTPFDPTSYINAAMSSMG